MNWKIYSVRVFIIPFFSPILFIYMYLFTSVSSEEATQIKSTTSRTQIPRMRRLTLLRPCRPNIFSSVAQSNPSCMENMLKKIKYWKNNFFCNTNYCRLQIKHEKLISESVKIQENCLSWILKSCFNFSDSYELPTSQPYYLVLFGIFCSSSVCFCIRSAET